MRSTAKFSFRKIVLILGFFLLIPVISLLLKKPSNNRNWAEEVAIMPEPTFTGDVLTIKHVRDWRYDSNGPISKQYIDRTYSLNDLEKVWFLVEPFSGWDGIAHTYFVFDFKNQEPLSLSVESRREKGVGFSPFIGLFRAYDLIYLWGTEQDFTTGRVLYQKNDVYMYPLKTSKEFNQKLIINLAEKTSDLLVHPQFYDTITDNCTSTLADRANLAKKDAVPFHYARILTGYSGKLVYDLGYIDNSLPYEEIKAKYKITEKVKNLHTQDNFSQLLRETLE